ncbi:MAG: hypothetical protein ACXWC0_23400 [Burkholderiales bacterium]
MRDLLILAVHLLVTVAKLLRPGGARAVAAESLLLKHQLQISNRSRRRSPNLTSLDRFLLGLTSLFVSPRRIAKLAAILKPATLSKFHNALVERKYRLLFSSSAKRCKPGPKGPSLQVIAAILEIKTRNPKFGYLRIAQQISHVFGIDIDKDVVRRVLSKHFQPGGSGCNGPSWLTVIAHAKDSLWSVDLFRCESILLRSHWVLLVMDVFTRRFWGRACIRRRRIRVSDVQSCHCRPTPTEACQHRSRPTLSVSPLARQLARPRDRSNQVGSICSGLASFRRTVDWNDPA